MLKKTSLIKPQMLLAQSLVLLTLGVMILVRPEMVNAMLSALLAVALIANAVVSLMILFGDRFGRFHSEAPFDHDEDMPLRMRIRRSWRIFLTFLRKQQRMPLIINAVLSIILAVLVMAFNEIITDSFGIGFGLWAFLTSVVQLAYVWQLRLTGSKGRLNYLVRAFISLAFTLALLIRPLARMINAQTVAGIYTLWQGISAFAEYLKALFKWDMAHSRVLMRVRIQPPVMLTSFLPVWLLDKFNRMLENNNTDHIYEKPAAGEPASDISKNNLTILFHLGHNVALGYGHVDFALGNQVYSYGCYDDASSRFMNFYSDGTFMLTKLRPYLDYCRHWQNKTLVSFTMRLTVEQEKSVRSSIEATLKECQPWQPTERNSPAIGMSAHASSKIPMKFYKVTSGPFKIYSALKTNCVAMAEILVGQTGVKVLPSHGIITPGSYYAFLDRQLKDPDSPVIRKTVYKIKGRQMGSGVSAD